MHLKNELLNHNVAVTDATIVTVGGRQNYVRNFSTGNTVVYHTMQKKTVPALKELDFLRKYVGILVHDHETVCIILGQTMRNAICICYVICARTRKRLVI